MKRLRNLKKRKGQSMLEYALILGVVSLVLTVAWQQFGNQIQELIRGTLTNKVTEGIEASDNN